VVMKTVNYLICKADKSIDIINWCAQVPVQHPDRREEGCAVPPGNNPAATFTCTMKEMNHDLNIDKLSHFFY
jgi:hypothetical protein